MGWGGAGCQGFITIYTNAKVRAVPASPQDIYLSLPNKCPDSMEGITPIHIHYGRDSRNQKMGSHALDRGYFHRANFLGMQGMLAHI
jgi:hypothetical protein